MNFSVMYFSIFILCIPKRILGVPIFLLCLFLFELTLKAMELQNEGYFPPIGNSEILFPAKLKRFSRREAAVAQELKTYGVIRSCFSRMRMLKSIAVSKPSIDYVDQYDYFKSVGQNDQDLLPKTQDGQELLKNLLERDIGHTKAKAKREFVNSYIKHHHFAVQVTFRYPYHHWDADHVVGLFKPLIQFERDVSRVSFHNRGGRFIVIYCPILLQALKAIQCVVSNIKNGESFMFSDAAVVVDYFPSSMSFFSQELSRGAEDIIVAAGHRDKPKRQRNTLREKKKKLALKLLREKQLLPPGRSVIDQRVAIINSTCDFTPKLTEKLHPLYDSPSSHSPFLGNSINSLLSPMTSLPNKHTHLPALTDRSVTAQDPNIERRRDTYPILEAHSCFRTYGDSITDFCSGKEDNFVSMRIDSKYMNQIPLDESLRDCDLLGEVQLPIRQRRAKERFTVLSPPPKEQIQHYFVVDGIFHRKCALSQPGNFFVEGDRRLDDLSEASDEEEESAKVKLAIEVLRIGDISRAQQIVSSVEAKYAQYKDSAEERIHTPADSSIGSDSEQLLSMAFARKQEVTLIDDVTIGVGKANRRRESVNWLGESTNREQTNGTRVQHDEEIVM